MIQTIVQSNNSNNNSIKTPIKMQSNNNNNLTADGNVSTTSDELDSSVKEVGGGNGSNNKKITTTIDAKIAKGGRALVMLAMLTSAITLSSLAYILLSNSQEDAFQAEFQSSARQVTLMANRNAINFFTGMQTMATMLPAAVEKETNQRFPFVTLNGYDALVSGIRNMTNATSIGWAPIINTPQDLKAWNEYSIQHTYWIADGRKYQNHIYDPKADKIMPFVYTFDNMSGSPVPEDAGSLPVAPGWQISPVPPTTYLVNLNWFTHPELSETYRYVHRVGKPDITKPFTMTAVEGDVEGPVSLHIQPIFDTVNPVIDSKVVGLQVALLGWKRFLENTLPDGQNEIDVIVDSCGEKSTFRIHGSDTAFVGYGDLHNPRYHSVQVTSEFINQGDAANTERPCRHYIHLYPTQGLEDMYRTNTPLQYAVGVVFIFVFATVIFLAYDWFVTNRQYRTERTADQSNAIVQELFPGDTANRLFASSAQESSTKSSLALSGFGKIDRTTIAELHPEATVLFADISGFTAWSSIRDPHQVFTLLESIFQAFDAIAKRCGVFKVETVGDCYVAACGVPKENLHHAVVMCRFARHAMVKFRSVCRSLELLLGPDTSDLALRIGVHSGPVTAGVLRGDRARFQLFGDTVNTAARIENTGVRERVHLSEQTADQLIKHGKEDWIVKRDDLVEAKGKGVLVTYWLKLSNLTKTNDSVAGSSALGDDENVNTISKGANLETSAWCVEMPSSKSDKIHDRNELLVHWNSDLLLELLQCVVARRIAVKGSCHAPEKNLSELASSLGEGQMVVEEVAEVIDMPEFACVTSTAEAELTDDVKDQLRAYITEVASMYNNNPFHNFEHASHVTMSIHKLLTRIVAPKLDENSCSDDEHKEALLHDHTYGITSDPLTQFSVVLSGLIHDLDHPGVSNAQLAKENPTLGGRYQGRSVAEQNSVDLAWSLLMSPTYDQLRDAIFTARSELQRFRSLLVNSVIATDIFDKDQSTLRKNRWNKAFFETTPTDESHEARSRKATIVIEHLIQASDVAHTMQHWHVYQKWNQRLFNEMMTAFRSGRSDKDPSLGWYGGELWFFDNYVIPLTQKLKDCGVFGVSSDEYLNYALHNRDEWESKGKHVVQQYVQEFEALASKMTKQNSTRFVI